MDTIPCLRDGAVCHQETGKLLDRDDIYLTKSRYGVGRYRLVDRQVKDGFTYFYSVSAGDSTSNGTITLLDDELTNRRSAVEADGVQIPEAGLPTRTVRSIMGRYVVLGRSVHSVEAAHQAGRDGAEFVVAGTIYKSPSKPDVKPVGAGLISEITKDSTLPVLAIGGVTADKVEELIQAGAAGVAVVSAITKADDPKAAAEELTKALKEAWANRASTVAASA